MAKYNLGFFDNENSEVINLSYLVKINKLEDIDNFTMQFDSSYQLLNYLLENEIIAKEDLNKKIRIIYKSGDKIKFKSIAYSDSKSYLKSNINLLKYKFHSLCNELNFIEELNKFYEGSKYVFTNALYNCRNYINSIPPNEKQELINNVYEDALFIKGNFSYSGFRRLALFMYKFELKKQKDITINNQNSNLNEVDDYVEPDFPPNSEEERNYKEYLKYQDKNWDKNKDYYDKFYPTKKK